ncbi:MAG: DUF4430 domain-containing protein [Candidatus Thorarchaeota archaeon]
MIILRRVKYWWVLPLVPLLLLSLPVSSLGESSSDAIIAAEGLSLSVDFGNGTIISFSDLNGSTVFDVTSEVLNIQIQWYGPLVYIRGIEGVVAEGQYGWQYWVNDEFVSIAANLYSLEDGDTVSWIFSSPDPETQQDPTLIPGVSIVSILGLGFIAVLYIQTSRKLKQ